MPGDMMDDDGARICQWCEDPIAIHDFMLRYSGQWHHPDCARDHAAHDGTTWEQSLKEEQRAGQ